MQGVSGGGGVVRGYQVVAMSYESFRRERSVFRGLMHVGGFGMSEGLVCREDWCVGFQIKGGLPGIR